MSKILVVPKSKLKLPSVTVKELRSVVNRYGVWADRATVETDFTRVQVIPYLVLLNEADIFCYKRIGNNSEKRLQDNFSIGLGGHIEMEDWSGTDMWQSVTTAAYRELYEEVSISNTDKLLELHCSNFTIYDESNDVSRVHIGVLFLIDASGRTVEVVEKDKIEGGFVNLHSLAESDKPFETWSKIVLDRMHNGLVKLNS